MCKLFVLRPSAFTFNNFLIIWFSSILSLTVSGGYHRNVLCFVFDCIWWLSQKRVVLCLWLYLGVITETCSALSLTVSGGYLRNVLCFVFDCIWGLSQKCVVLCLWLYLGFISETCCALSLTVSGGYLRNVLCFVFDCIWGLSQKRFVLTKLDIYVLYFIKQFHILLYTYIRLYVLCFDIRIKA
jgi:hypothetical protein